MVHAVRHWVSFVIGLVIALFGLFSLIGKESWLGPAGGLTGSILAYVLAFGGLYMVFDSFFEYSFHSGIFITTFIAGIVVFGLGIINVLHSFDAVAFSVPIPAFLYDLLFVVEGLFLVIATFVMD